MGIEIRVENIEEGWAPAADVIGAVFQNPGQSGVLRDLAPQIDRNNFV